MLCSGGGALAPGAPVRGHSLASGRIGLTPVRRAMARLSSLDGAGCFEPGGSDRGRLVGTHLGASPPCGL